MPKPITKKQRSILNHLQKIQAHLGYRPSYRDLGKALGLASPATVYTHLKTLEKNGYVRRDEQNNFVPIQRLAVTAAEIPLSHILTDRGLELIIDISVIAVPAQMLTENEMLAVKVTGTIWQTEFLLPNDILVVEKTDFIPNARLIIGQLPDNQTVIRKYFREAASIRLASLNPAVPPIFTQKIDVIGIIQGVLRKFE